MHKNEALPCLARLDPASHPVETVGMRRVALGYDSMGLRVEARKDTRESTFNILRKYFHRLTKVYSAADERTFENLLPLPPENIYLLRRRTTTSIALGVLLKKAQTPVRICASHS